MPAMADASRSADVIVIGAGAGGLAAARLLTARGLHVEIVEARERIGGRCAPVYARRTGVPG
jgi:phytoene dehydrogenase-like protein